MPGILEKCSGRVQVFVTGDYRQAEGLFRQVLRLLNGDLSRERYRRTGQREQAREHLTTAMTMYHEMDMRFWLEQAEAETEALA